MSSFYPDKARKTWRVMKQIYKDGKSQKPKQVPREAYAALGKNPNWTYEELREGISRINKSKKLEKGKIAQATRQALKARVVESVFFPQDECEAFVKFMRKSSFGSESYILKMTLHFQYIQRMIAHLQTEPAAYFDNKDDIYRYFINRHNSLDYVKKLLRVLNLWGTFICEKREQFFKPVPKPAGQVREKINDSYYDSKSYVGPSEPLRPELLEQKNSLLTVAGNYEWLYASIWFGLRSEEIESFSEKKNWNLHAGEDGTKFLSVYQSKLTSILQEKRWKYIPLQYPEQMQALRYLKHRRIKKPLY